MRNSDGNFEAICSGTNEDDRKITELLEVLELQTMVRIESGNYGTLNLLSQNYFAVINDSLRKSIPRQAQCVLKLQDQGDKHMV